MGLDSGREGGKNVGLRTAFFDSKSIQLARQSNPSQVER